MSVGQELRIRGPQGRLAAQAAAAPATGSDLRWGVRGAPDRAGLLAGAGGAAALDGALDGREGGRAGLGAAGVTYDGPASVKKNELQPHLKKYWRIPPPDERGVGRLHGRRAGRLRSTLCGAAAGRLHGRNQQATDPGSAGETAGRARPARALGARVGALRCRADLPGSGTLDRSAACRGRTASHALTPMSQTFGRSSSISSSVIDACRSRRRGSFARGSPLRGRPRRSFGLAVGAGLGAGDSRPPMAVESLDTWPFVDIFLSLVPLRGSRAELFYRW